MPDALALLRGVNVGGKNKVPMGELRAAMETAGFDDARTYIASGNVIFKAKGRLDGQARNLRELISTQFGVDCEVVAFTAKRWCRIVSDAPAWWGTDDDYAHNIYVVIEPLTAADAVDGIGALRDEIESVQAGDGAVYQSHSKAHRSQGATSSKIVGTKIYKKLTIRNYNTAIKLAELLGTNPKA